MFSRIINQYNTTKQFLVAKLTAISLEREYGYFEGWDAVHDREK